MALEREEIKTPPLAAGDLAQHIAGKKDLRPFELEHLADIYLSEQLLPADLAKRLAELVFAGGNHFYDALSLVRHKLKKPEVPDEAVEEALLDIAIRAIQIAASGIEFTTVATGAKISYGRKEAREIGVKAVCANFHINFESAERLVDQGIGYYDNLQKCFESHSTIQRRKK